MQNQKLQILNDFWSNQLEIHLLKLFKIEDEFFWGSIKLDAPPKEALIFDVRIPLSYPLSNDSMSIRFYCKNVEGYRHINNDHSLCLIVPKNFKIKDRLVDEVKLLKEWRDKYYINEEKDEKYDYLIVTPKNNNTFLFTDINVNFKKGESGQFTGLHISKNNFLDMPDSSLYFIQSIGKSKCQWSNLLSIQKPDLHGFYYFIEQEPLNKKSKNIDNWIEFDKFFNQQFKEQLFKLKLNLKFPAAEIFLLIGYNIPDNQEIHWQMAKLDCRTIPVAAKRVTTNYYEYNFINQEINWSKTFNSSYSRFFGRGAIHEDIANSKILVVGAGAIGSSLSKILVRAGAKNISFCDNDLIEPGNLCRSEYFITKVTYPKCLALFQQLHLISPFVNLGIEPEISKILDQFHIEKEKARLEKYDYIFDCTSDVELAYVLDHLKLKNLIFNMSISNEAKELVCVIGNKNVYVEKEQIFKNLANGETSLYYEGTGCWSPTFKASFFDINSLVNQAVKRINIQYMKRKSFNSFVIKNENDNLLSFDY